MKDSNKKRIHGTNQKRRNVCIDDERFEKFKSIGDGSISEGIRIACDAFKIKKS